MQIPYNTAGRTTRLRQFPLAFLAATLAMGGFQGLAPAAEEAKPSEAGDSAPAETKPAVPQKDEAVPAPIPPDPNDSLLVPDLEALPPPEMPRFRSPRRRISATDSPSPDEEMDEKEELAKPYTYTVPGFFGSGPTTLTAGRGPLAGPRFRTSISVGAGYDDNIRSGESGAGAEKVASAFTNLNVASSYKTAALAQVFIFNAGAGVDLYWDEADPDYQASLGLTYLRRFVAPYSVSANLALSYQSQPSYGTVNFARASTDSDGEEDETGNLAVTGKVDFTYHWGPQFSTVTSLGADTRLYGSRSEDNEFHITLGNEFRYRVDRYTWVGDVRYETITSSSGGQQDSDSWYLLAGLEWRLGPWIQVSARGGESIRAYGDGGSTISPHGEFSITFAPNIQNSFSLNARYGLETSPDGDGDSTTFRIGLSYNRVFTHRLSGTISLNYVRSEENEESRGEESGSGVGGERIIDAVASLNYRLSTRMSLSGSVTCTRGDAGVNAADPDRNRVMVSANYEF